MASSLAEQRVLVIGGSSGIGLATASSALAAGAHVTIASRTENRLDTALAELGQNARAVVLDTGDNTAIEAFFAGYDAWNHIVISAARTAMGPMREMDLDRAYAAMDSKFWGTYRVARAAKLVRQGTITFISGLLSERPSPTSVLQGAINAGLEGLARGLALELAPIRVNTVSPGMIDTPLWDRMLPEQRDAAFARTAENLPVRRVGLPADIANAVLYLMTTGFATGSTVRVDGGGAIA